MSGRRASLAAIAAESQYAIEAYEFLCHALPYTQERLGRAANSERTNHVSGRELLEGIRLFALEQFGMMACVVFRMWGLKSTSDFGRMVYQLIELGEWHSSPEDRIEDFDDSFDFDQAFVRDYQIVVDED